MYKHTGYTKVLIAILSIVLIVSCAPDPTLEPENQYIFSPERTAAPALTKIPPTPTLTATATTTPTSVPLILQGTPFPTPQEVISNQNADRLTALARWGNGSLNFIALSPEGTLLAAATTISVVLYTADTLEVIKTLLTDSEVNAVSFSIDGKTLAIGTSDGAQLWDLSDEITPLDLSNNESSRVNSLVFSPNGLWLAAGTEDGVLIFDAATGKSLFTLEGGKDLHADAIAFSSDNKLLAAALTKYNKSTFSHGGSYIQLWDTATWQKQNLFTGDNTWGLSVGHPGSLSFSPDSKTLAVPSGWTYAWLWNSESGKTVQPSVDSLAYYLEVLTISPDGKTLAGGDNYGLVFLWDTATGENRRTLQQGKSKIQNLVFSPNGKRLYVASEDGIRLWNLAKQSVARRAVNHAPVGEVISVSPDGTRLATLYDKEIMIWDIASGEKLQTFPGTQYAVISSNWSVLATRSVGEQVLLIYDLESGRVTHRLDRGVNQGTTGIYISPDGKVLASREQASKNKLLLWDTTSGSLVHELPDAYSTRGFTPDGKYVVSVMYETLDPDRVILQYWDVATGVVEETDAIGQRIIDLGVFTTDSDTTIGDIAFSPDGTSIAMGFNDIFLFWDGVQRSPGWTFKKYCLGTCLLTFSPDGKVLAISETVGDFITLYDAINGEKLAELRGDARWIIGFVFSPDGTRLISSGKNGVIDIFGIP